jgi:hypothetical protein
MCFLGKGREKERPPKAGEGEREGERERGELIASRKEVVF